MLRSAQSPALERERCLSDEVLFAFATGTIDARARAEAESHLADCGDCRAVLVQALSDADEEERDVVGAKRIGRYELLELLGAGSAGVVYRAFDTELERVVAIKVLVAGAEQATTGRKQRILREARAMAQLSHPSVVTVFDVGVSDGAVFIVMEYVPGATLERWLHVERRTPVEIVSAFAAAGRGLQAAHEKRIVHRDFKSENVLVSRERQVRVTDFGLARSLDSAQPDVLASLRDGDVSTRTRGIFGTPAYMAPELFDGRPADAASDQFSFCVALLGALIGRHPFGADQGIAMSELVKRIREQRIDPAGARVPAALRDVLLRGVRAEPRARFADMRALLAALEHAAAPLRRPHRFARAPMVTVAVAVALAVGGAFATSQLARTSLALERGVFGGVAPAAARALASIQQERSVAPARVSTRGRAADLPASSLEPSRRGSPARARTKQPEPARYHDALREPF